MPKIADQQHDKRVKQTLQLLNGQGHLDGGDFQWPTFRQIADHVRRGGSILVLPHVDGVGAILAYPKHLDVVTIERMAEHGQAPGVVLTGPNEKVHGNLHCEPF